MNLFTTLLLAAVTATGGQTIEGFTIPVESTWEAPQVDGETTVMDGARMQKVNGRNEPVVMHSVRITDLLTLSPTPTDNQVFEAHEGEIRALPHMVAQNLRRSMAKFGEHDVLMLSGTAKVQDDARKARGAYVFSMAFVVNHKAYEFSQVSFSQDALNETIKALPKFTVKEGGRNLALAGGPIDLRGDYTMAEVPFVVTFATAPRVEVASSTSGYDIAYGASDLEPPVGPQYSYQLRRLKENEGRSDSELFWDIAKTMLNTETALNQPGLFVVKGGSGTDDTEYKLSGVQHVRFRFARSGDWVAVFAVRASADKGPDLTQFALKVVE